MIHDATVFGGMFAATVKHSRARSSRRVNKSPKGGLWLAQVWQHFWVNINQHLHLQYSTLSNRGIGNLSIECFTPLNNALVVTASFPQPPEFRAEIQPPPPPPHSVALRGKATFLNRYSCSNFAGLGTTLLLCTCCRYRGNRIQAKRPSIALRAKDP